MPLAGRNLYIGGCELQAASIHHAVEPEIVLQSIRPHHVIALWVSKAENQSDSLINLPGERFSFDAEVKFCVLAFVGDKNGEAGIGGIRIGLLYYMLSAGSIGHFFD